MSAAPTIMVSSTFYDLRQIRKDLSTFIADILGYIPLLSEMPSFPVDPDITTIENCRRRVEQNADILILVIGGRYGTIDLKSEKSITNLEFLAARSKGIPIYVFVERSVLSILPVWKSNPDGNFLSVVDTTKLFDFIELVRKGEQIWTFEFESAQDIIATLRIQFAYLLQDSIKAKIKLSGSGMPRFMEKLRPLTLRLVLEKPSAWEYRLFLQSWIDEVEQHSSLLREYRDELRLESVENVLAKDATEWLQTKIHELECLVDSGNQLINKSLQTAFGNPGEPGDAEHILWVSHTIGRILGQTVHWANKIRCARCEPPFDKVAPEVSLFADDLINQFISFPVETLKEIEATLLLPIPSEPQKLKFTITFTLANQDRFNLALNEAKRQYGIL
jgi:hypothetical protein